MFEVSLVVSSSSYPRPTGELAGFGWSVFGSPMPWALARDPADSSPAGLLFSHRRQW
jgi:hypothetical protein